MSNLIAYCRLIKPVVMKIIIILFSYLSGSILFSEIFMRLVHHQSLIEVSSNHNPGASNAFIYGGKPCGILSVLGDLLKAIIPVRFYIALYGYASYGLAFVILANALGHAYSIFFQMKGGMCITVSFGTLLALYPYFQPVCFLAGFYIFLLIIHRTNNQQSTYIAFVAMTVCCLIIHFKQIIPFSIVLGTLFLLIVVSFKMSQNIDYKK